MADFYFCAPPQASALMGYRCAIGVKEEPTLSTWRAGSCRPGGPPACRRSSGSGTRSWRPWPPRSSRPGERAKRIFRLYYIFIILFIFIFIFWGLEFPAMDLLLWQVFGISDFLLCTMLNENTVCNQYTVYYDVILTYDDCVLKGE